MLQLPGQAVCGARQARPGRSGREEGRSQVKLLLARSPLSVEQLIATLLWSSHFLSPGRSGSKLSLRRFLSAHSVHPSVRVYYMKPRRTCLLLLLPHPAFSPPPCPLCHANWWRAFAMLRLVLTFRVCLVSACAGPCMQAKMRDVLRRGDAAATCLSGGYLILPRGGLMGGSKDIWGGAEHQQMSGEGASTGRRRKRGGRIRNLGGSARRLAQATARMRSKSHRIHHHLHQPMLRHVAAALDTSRAGLLFMRLLVGRLDHLRWTA